jgi:ferredoxin-NADP reductase
VSAEVRKPPTFAPRLLSARDEAPGVRTFRFASPAGFRFLPGQFMLFHFQDDPKTWRAYSFCSSPAAAPEWFEVTVGMVGAFSDRLGALEPGGEHGLVARGPYGRWTYDGGAEHAVLVSGGTGVTPFRAMILAKLDQGWPGKITLACSARTPAGLLYRAEHRTWSRGGVTVHATVTRPETAPDQPWDGPTGRLDLERLRRVVADFDRATFYLCGPGQMVKELKGALAGAGVGPERLRVESWGDYADLI